MDTALAMAARLIRQCEGCVLTPYQDTGGTWTIGIGSTRCADGSTVCADTPAMTQAEADALMMAELRPTAASVDAMAPPHATVPQRAALYSFAYNLGTGALKESTLLRKLRAGDDAGAAAEFDRWVYVKGARSKGLVNRRRLERDVFEGSVVP